MDLVIQPDGTVRAVYSEEIDLSAFGHPLMTRASHVEPDEQGCWHADLTPIGGPILGSFPMRSEALDAELTWLRTHWLSRGPA
jgi:hypothetical protein